MVITDIIVVRFLILRYASASKLWHTPVIIILRTQTIPTRERISIGQGRKKINSRLAGNFYRRSVHSKNVGKYLY